MRLRYRLALFIIAWGVALHPGRAHAMVFISEILADPKVGVEGDANGDGVTSSSADEFIEILNTASASVDLTGWRISDSVATRHVFAENSVIAGGGFLVVFGGGNPQLSAVNWQKASTGGLSLNNAADNVFLYDGAGILAGSVQYGPEGGEDQSLTRRAEGESFQLHGLLPDSNGRLFSPGTNPDGSLFELPQAPPSAAVPEPGTLMLFLGSGALTALMRLDPGRP